MLSFKKQVLFFLLVLVIGITLAGCKSAAVKDVEEMISRIGTVSESSEDLITQAENAFQALSENDKNRVSNYNTLLQARRIYDAIPKEVTLTLDNYKEYFDISCTYGDTYTEYVADIFETHYVEALLDIYQVSGSTLRNVTMQLRITVPEDWDIAYDDALYSSYNQDTKEVVLLVKIPSNGQFSQTIVLDDLFSYKPDEACKIDVISVSGTVIDN